MKNEQLTTTPPKEEPTQKDAMPWQDRFYNAILEAFPQPLFHRCQKDGIKDVVSWTSDGHRFFFSWHELDKDETAFEAVNHSTD